MGKLFGNDMVVMVDSGNGYEVAAYATTCELDIKAETKEISSRNSGRWVRLKKGKIRWNGSAGTLLADNGQAEKIISLVKSDKKVVIMVASVAPHPQAQSSSDYKPDGRFAFKGYALITRVTTTGQRGSMATMSIEFNGSGEAVTNKDAELPDDNENNEGGGGGDGGDTTLGDLLNVANDVDKVPEDDRILYQESGSGTWTWKKASEIMPDISKIRADLYGTFIRRDIDDRTEHALSVGGKLTAEEALYVGEFISSLDSGTGAGIDKQGNAEVQSIRVRGSFMAYEYIVNRINAIEGDEVLSESDTVEKAVDMGDNCWGLTLRSKWDGYFTAMVAGSVIKGKINTLGTGSGVYYDSWMRINLVNTAANYIEVSLYPDDEVPDGKNYPPCETMKIVRYGHQTDETRQSCIILSSIDKAIKRLRNVTKPIIDISNYGMYLGTLPEAIRALNPELIQEGEDYLFVRGVVATNYIEVDPTGKAVAEIVDRGAWDENSDYFAGGWREETQKYEQSDVWNYGCRWRCMKEGTKTEPRWNNTDWAFMEGNPDFTVAFEEIEQLYDADNFHATLTMVAKLYNQDITGDITAEQIEWTRYTTDESGNQRAASDNIWALNHAGIGKQVELTWDDLDADAYMPPTIKFICTVTLKDGMTEKAIFTKE